MPPPIIGGGGVAFSGHPSVRPLSVRPLIISHDVISVLGRCQRNFLQIFNI